MRVDKKFAPVTITLETEEELDFMLSIIDKAKRYYMSSGRPFLSSRKHEDTFMMKSNYFEAKLK